MRPPSVIIQANIFCCYHTRALRHIRGLLSAETAALIGCSIVASRIDYCNSLLFGAPESTLDKVQRSLNALARVVTNGNDNATTLMRSLHWLPVRQRITYKLALLTFKVNHTGSPHYLHSLLQPRVCSRSLRSSAAPTFEIPRHRTNIGKRAFSVAAPIVWNNLPATLRLCNSVDVFKKLLKTHLFNDAYST